MPDCSLQSPPSPGASWRCARLILGDQLHAGHSWFAEPDPQCLYIMMEIRAESEYVKHHVQKIAGIFAAMRSFAKEQQEKGFVFCYLKISDPENRHAFAENLAWILKRYGIERLEYQLPDEYRLDQLLAGLGTELGCELHRVDSEHFLTTREELGEFFGESKNWLMETFYRAMRRKHDILLDDKQKPLGGRWNFDQENRKKLPRGHFPLPPLTFENDLRSIVSEIHEAKLPFIGEIDAARFLWPVNRTQALELLEDFLLYRLEHFGLYQDALSDQHWSIYHSRIAHAMNLKLLGTHEVLQRAVAHWQKHQAQISMAQIEGFVRQILGWREYVRGVYWHHMPNYAQLNALQHTRALPGYFWTGKTKMRCVQRAIEQSLQYGYAHHIQRLMATGNFCALAGIDPAQVDAWYLGIYVDAFEWVQLPNTRGMSQFADGGMLATKPYVSSANYLKKMGDHCGSCHYNPNRKTEEDACPFNSLYWHFLHRNQERLRSNHRMAMMYRQYEKLKDREAILQRAEGCLEGIEAL